MNRISSAEAIAGELEKRRIAAEVEAERKRPEATWETEIPF